MRVTGAEDPDANGFYQRREIPNWKESPSRRQWYYKHERSHTIYPQGTHGLWYLVYDTAEGSRPQYSAESSVAIDNPPETGWSFFTGKKSGLNCQAETEDVPPAMSSVRGDTIRQSSNAAKPVPPNKTLGVLVTGAEDPDINGFYQRTENQHGRPWYYKHGRSHTNICPQNFQNAHGVWHFNTGENTRLRPRYVVYSAINSVVIDTFPPKTGWRFGIEGKDSRLKCQAMTKERYEEMRNH